jgi:ribosomal protein S18 acetylase RimI-like enzyme
MERISLIEAVTTAINVALAAGAEPDESQLQWRDQDAALVEQVLAAYRAAQQPQTFYNIPISQMDDRFEQAFELLRQTFAPEVLDPREAYAAMLGNPDEPPDDFVMIGRFWRVSGSQSYSPEGMLTHFGYDPLTSTEGIAGVVVGGYLSLEDGTGFGAISYLATRPALRRGQGHGTILTREAEQAIQRCAQGRNERLRCIVLEAEDRARFYWAKRGYRYPRDSVYYQPSLTFDPSTGEPTSKSVMDYLMLKFMDVRGRESIPRDELLTIVRALYEDWYIPEFASLEATAAARHHVIDTIYQHFVESLGASVDRVDLIWPPDNIN